MFWAQELKADRDDLISVKLQPFKAVQTEASKGCGLCQVLAEGYISMWDSGFVHERHLYRAGIGEVVKCRRESSRFSGAPDYSIFGRFQDLGLYQKERTDIYPVPSSWCKLLRSSCYLAVVMLTFAFPRVGLRSPDAVDENSNILLMKDWIDNCRRNHTICNNGTRHFLPTRLLDLQAFDECSPHSESFEDDIKLVCSLGHCSRSAGPVPDYITLSHCWGPPEKRPAITTHSNLADRMERITFADLPKTFQNAVVLTRKLGVRYLWIDSLCIIQDDEDEWANEASMMSEVYTQSFCTLAALSSADSTEGLRVPGKLQEKKKLSVDLGVKGGNDEPFNVRLFGREPESWKREYNAWINDKDRRPDLNPLAYRAWALQEKELSTRSIHFGFRQLLWECRELKGSSQLPWCTARDREDRFGLDQELSYIEDLPEDWVLPYSMSMRWLSISEEYSSRSLTHETDKITALSGIAQSFRKYFPKDEYVAGIWSSHLPLALLWHPDHHINKQRTTEYVAPSWSWASYPCTIKYEIYQLLYSFSTRARKASRPDKWLHELEVVSLERQPKHNDIYGALKEGATLTLSGALLIDLEVDTVLDVQSPLVILKDRVDVGSFWPDLNEPPQGKLVCLGICGYGRGVRGLVLREHNRDGSPVYSRVGYVQELDRALWDDSERRQITLI